jgi:hypothetical protein
MQAAEQQQAGAQQETKKQGQQAVPKQAERGRAEPGGADRQQSATARASVPQQTRRQP